MDARFAHRFSPVTHSSATMHGERLRRVPSPPPLAVVKAFSRSGCGRIFPLFSRVMREGLNTGMGARSAESVLLEPVFSGPHDCADLVNSLQASDLAMFFRG